MDNAKTKPNVAGHDVNKPTPVALAATVIGPLLAAEGKSPNAQEVARRLFELADAISAEQKKRAAARPPGKG